MGASHAARLGAMSPVVMANPKSRSATDEKADVWRKRGEGRATTRRRYRSDSAERLGCYGGIAQTTVIYEGAPRAETARSAGCAALLSATAPTVGQNGRSSVPSRAPQHGHRLGGAHRRPGETSSQHTLPA